MTPPLFFVADLGTGDVLELTGAEAHHAATVKRISIGECVLLADGRGGRAHAHVRQAGRDRVLLEIADRTFDAEPVPRFVVVQALPKTDRADLAVEALTELGVDEIVPWSASRSISLWKGDKAEKGVAKWRRTATEAAKQSRRSRIPIVTDLASTADVLARIAQAGTGVLLHEDAVEPLADLKPDGHELLLVIGPEGGLAPEEIEQFVAGGARTARLGSEVLRTSTAGAAALAVLSVASGRWGLHKSG